VAILSARNLEKSFGAVRALDGVTVEVPRGATGLLGPNGAGKTTFLRVLLGLLPARGEARVLDLDPQRDPRAVRARIGYMPESECLIAGLNALEVVAYLGRLAGMPRRDAFQRAHEVLFYVGLGEARYRDAAGFSMGMQQRLKLATALVHDPDLLFLDEPTNGLDPGGRTEMLGLVRELARDHGKHVLLSSHLLRDVEQVCSGVIVFHRGRLVQSVDLDELARSAPSAYDVEVDGDRGRFVQRLREDGAQVEGDGRLAVVLPSGHDSALLFRAAVDAGARIRGLERTRRSLEQVFFDAIADGAAPALAGELRAGGEQDAG